MYVCYQVQGAVFDLPEEIAKNLLSKEMPPGTTITKISKVFIFEKCLVFVNLSHY